MIKTPPTLAGLLSLAVALTCSACQRSSSPASGQQSSPAPAIKPAPPTPLAEQKQDLGGPTWDPSWDALVEKALPPELLSSKAARAVHGFCPNFARESEADKRAFWAYFFQALAGAEAGLDKTVVAHHTEAAVNRTDEITHRPVKQQGLLQLTYDDADRYQCDFNWEHDRSLPEKDPRRTILEPANNLGCGIHILTNQIITRDKPLISKGSYWSPLQPGTKSYHVFAKQMANVPAACDIGPLKPSRSVAAGRHASATADSTR